jgi:hypothetical protein
MDVDRLGHDPGAVGRPTSDRQVIADHAPARPDRFDRISSGSADNGPKLFRKVDDRIRIAGQESLRRDRALERTYGRQVTTPISFVPRPEITQPPACSIASASSAAWKRASFAPAGSIHS